MRSLMVASCLLAACGSSPPRTAPCPIATVVPAAAPRPPIDDVTLKSRSHALVDAFDQADDAAFGAQLDRTFVLFKLARTYDGARILDGLRSRRAAKAPVIPRTWTDERVTIGDDVAMFFGESFQHYPANEDHAASESDEWDTIVWVRAGDAWRVAHWQIQKAGAAAERDLWNDTFVQSVGFNHEANKLLVEAVRGKKPGTALDIAMGQGRNAVYLATQGWRVTGVDVSNEGIEIAKAAAAKNHVPLTAVEQDIDTYDVGKERWDLITLIYAGNDPKTLAKIQAGLKHGGLFVVEFFAKESSAGTGIGGFAPGELAKAFPGWKIQKDEIVEDVADWSLRKTKLARFVAQKP